MVVCRLSDKLINELEENLIPPWIEKAKKENNFIIINEYDRFKNRNKNNDFAVFTLYSYADLSLSSTYDTIFEKNNLYNYQAVNCRIEHAIFNGWFPSNYICHGHKHVLFLSFDSCIPQDIVTINNFNRMISDWKWGICNIDTLNSKIRRLGHQQSDD